MKRNSSSFADNRHIARCAVSGVFKAGAVLKAIEGCVPAEAGPTGIHTLDPKLV